MAAALPRLDFLRPQRRLSRWWPVAAGAVLLLVVLGVSELQRREIERLQAAVPSARVAPPAAPTPRRAAIDAATARHLAGLHHDWSADLSVLDGLRLPGLRWLRWEFEVATREWQLEGEVDQLADLLRLSADLAPLGRLQLQRIDIPQQAIRFDLRVQAQVARPVTAGAR